jgi:short-subunit dehydrogenase
MSNYSNQVVLITGASSGIGAALAKEYALQGAKLILLARRVDRLKEIAAAIDPSRDRVLTVPCDVTIANDLENAVSLARQHFGTIDIVIANAGWSLKGNLQELSVHDYERLWNTNVFGVLRTVYATLDDLKYSRGKLAIVGSVKSYIALAGDSPYSMSKFALRALSESLSQELAPEGISVIHICPGYVATEIRQINNQGMWHEDLPDPISPKLMMSADEAAKQIIQAIARGQRELVLSNYGKLIVFLKRHNPWLISWLISTFQIRVKSR